MISLSGNEVTKVMLKVFSKYQNANDALIHKWTELIFLSPRWWIGVTLAIVPWFIWWKLHNKNFKGDLLRAGFFMAIICTILDGVGVQLGLWFYPYDTFPFIPGYFPWDLTLFPITMMTMIEIKSKWNPFYKSLLIALFYSICEPLADFSKIYEPIIWKFYYSFPIYILLFLICNAVAKGKIFNSRF